MKLEEMTKICNEHKGICADCPLNCIKNWEHKKSKSNTWCLMSYREECTNKYRKAKAENNEVLANKIMKDYQKMEAKLIPT